MNSCRTIDITGYQKRFSALCLHLSGNLCRGRRLTCTLKTCHHNDGDLTCRTKRNLGCLRPHQSNEFFIYNLDYHLSRLKGTKHFLTDCPFLNGADELLDDLEADIRLEKCHLNFFQCGLYICFTQTSLASQVLKYILQFIG